MKDRTPIINKSYFERKTVSYENESCKWNRINNINTLIQKTYVDALNSENIEHMERYNN